MKVTFVFRERRKNNFSIEELFERVSARVSSTCVVSKYYCTSSNRAFNLAKVALLRSDLYHVTGDVNYLCMALPRRKLILTVHDLGYFLTAKGLRKAIYRHFWLQMPFSRASHITTISHFTKEQILRHFKVPGHKISVVHNPVPTEIFQRSEKANMGEFPKILQVGSAQHKNLDRLIDAVKGLRVELLLLREHTDEIERKLVSLGIKHRFFPTLSYREVYEKFVESDVVFFASSYEGFGMPILEAQAVGRPVITSKVASMPEVAGEGACLVDHESVSEIRGSLLRIMEDADYRRRIVSSGFRNLDRFSEDTICEKYHGVYETVYRKQLCGRPNY